MVASEGMLKAAIAKCEDETLREYFKQHLAEETGHVTMLEHDLAHLGVTSIRKFPLAAMMAGAQYYYIEHEHPALLLGYMAALECNSFSLAQIEKLELQFGSLTCARHHAIHDPNHAQDLRERIDALPEPLKARALANEQWTVNEWRTRAVPTIISASELQ